MSSFSNAQGSVKIRLACSKGSSLIYNTNARHECKTSDTSETRATPV